jgi:hypothetical protein
MTRLMKEAIEKLQSLPEEKQDAVADFLLGELEADKNWDDTSTKHASKLRKLADEALDDFRAGRTSELDADVL